MTSPQSRPWQKAKGQSLQWQVKEEVVGPESGTITGGKKADVVGGESEGTGDVGGGREENVGVTLGVVRFPGGGRGTMGVLQRWEVQQRWI